MEPTAAPSSSVTAHGDTGKAGERLPVGCDHRPIGGSRSGGDLEIVGAARTARSAHGDEQLGVLGGDPPVVGDPGRARRRLRIMPTRSDRNSVSTTTGELTPKQALRRIASPQHKLNQAIGVTEDSR